MAMVDVGHIAAYRRTRRRLWCTETQVFKQLNDDDDKNEMSSYSRLLSYSEHSRLIYLRHTIIVFKRYVPAFPYIRLFVHCVAIDMDLAV